MDTQPFIDFLLNYRLLPWQQGVALRSLVSPDLPDLVDQLVDRGPFPPKAKALLLRIGGILLESGWQEPQGDVGHELKRLIGELAECGRPRPNPQLFEDMKAVRPDDDSSSLDVELGVSPRAGRRWGDFEIEDEIAHGSFGIVYKARDSATGKTVALKVLKKREEADWFDQKLFKREGDIHRTLQHPNIVPVLDGGRIEGHLYLAMEFVNGIPLKSLLGKRTEGREEGTPIPWEAAIRIIAYACHAVEYAHSEQVIHRDIKPGNILVATSRPDWSKALAGRDLETRGFRPAPPLRTRDGENAEYWPVICDFGLAKSFRPDRKALTLTLSGRPIGTVAYMSPEAARGDRDKIDERSDVYSLGATLYHLVTGRMTFQTASKERYLARIIREEPPSPRWWVPGLPQEVETIVLTALMNEPTKRYASVRNMLDDLLSLCRTGRIARNPIPNIRPVVILHDGRDQSEMVRIEGGESWMGSSHRAAPAEERPRHRVTLKTYFIDSYPVTNVQYGLFLYDGHGEWCHPDEPVSKDHTPSTWSEEGWRESSLPVCGVDWWDAFAYAKWAGKRLPTEGEWEAACRIGCEGDYGFSNANGRLGDYAWYRENSESRTHPVGEKLPNAWGLYDMHGNVAEWCADWYDEDAYKRTSRMNPKGPSDGSQRAYRGGSYLESKNDVRCASRGGLEPHLRKAGDFAFLGIRCAKDGE